MNDYYGCVGKIVRDATMYAGPYGDPDRVRIVFTDGSHVDIEASVGNYLARYEEGDQEYPYLKVTTRVRTTT